MGDHHTQVPGKPLLPCPSQQTLNDSSSYVGLEFFTYTSPALAKNMSYSIWA